MSFQVFQAQGLRIFTGDTATISGYTGLAGEIAINTETKSVRILDGVNAGGTPLTTADAEELTGLSLDQLADLALSSPNEGDTLVYKNGSWTNDRLVDATAAVDEMSKMIDVKMTDLQTGHVLAYNAASMKWVNQATATVDHNHDARYQVKGTYLTDTSNLGEVNDVQITAPADGQSLVYNAGKWINSNAAGGGAYFNGGYRFKTGQGTFTAFSGDAGSQWPFDTVMHSSGISMNFSTNRWTHEHTGKYVLTVNYRHQGGDIWQILAVTKNGNSNAVGVGGRTGSQHSGTWSKTLMYDVDSTTATYQLQGWGQGTSQIGVDNTDGSVADGTPTLPSWTYSGMAENPMGGANGGLVFNCVIYKVA